MTIATTTFLKLNQSHFNQGIDYLPAASPSETSDYYQRHHFPYHFVAHQYYPHMHCSTPAQHCDHYGTTSKSGKSSHSHHTYQTIGPSTISKISSNQLHHEQHYAKPDNMGNIEIIDSKKVRCYDEMNNEI
jgi:hypothetical protein